VLLAGTARIQSRPGHRIKNLVIAKSLVSQ